MSERSNPTTTSGEQSTTGSPIRSGEFEEVHEHEVLNIPLFQLSEEIISAIRNGGPTIVSASEARPSLVENAAEVSPQPSATVETEATAESREPVDTAVAVMPGVEPDAHNTPSVSRINNRGPVAIKGDTPLTVRATRDIARRVKSAREYSRKVLESDNSGVSVSASINGESIVKLEGERSLSVRFCKALGRAAVKGREFSQNALKTLWERRDKFPKYAVAVGGIAVAAVFVGDKAEAISDSIQQHNIMNTSSGVVHNTVVERPIRSLVIGGNTQTVGPVGEFDAKGYAPGDRDTAIHWSADMGIGNPMVSAEQSIQDGKGALLREYYASHGRGEHTHISSYSFGTYAAQAAAWEIYRNNGNQWPADLTVDIIGGPMGAEGLTRGPIGKLGGKFLGLPEWNEQAFPDGAKVRYVYNDRDPYASGGNESMTSLLYSLMGIGYGTHEVPDRNDPNVHWTSFTDANGIEHLVAHRKNEWVIDALERAGIQIMDTNSANEAVRALFPRNDDPNAPPPEADVAKAMTLGARALDRQIDPSGNTKIFETIVENMPEPWKVLMNESWNGFNHMADAVARAINDPTPANIQNAFNTVMKEINGIMGGLNQVMGDSLPDDLQEWGVGSVGDIVKQTSMQYLGQEIDITPQLNSIIDKLQESAAAQREAALVKAQENGALENPITMTPNAANVAPQVNNPFTTLDQLDKPIQPSVKPEIPVSSQLGLLPEAPAPSTPEGIVPNLEAPSFPEVLRNNAPTPVVRDVAPQLSGAENTPPVPPVDVYIPPAPAREVPKPAPALAPVYEAPAPAPAPAPKPVWTPAPAPEYTPPPPPPAPAPAPAPVFIAPAPAPAPAPILSIPSFEMPRINLGPVAPAGIAPSGLPGISDSVLTGSVAE